MKTLSAYLFKKIKNVICGVYYVLYRCSWIIHEYGAWTSRHAIKALMVLQYKRSVATSVTRYMCWIACLAEQTQNYAIVNRGCMYCMTSFYNLRCHSRTVFAFALNLFDLDYSSDFSRRCLLFMCVTLVHRIHILASEEMPHFLLAVLIFLCRITLAFSGTSRGFCNFCLLFNVLNTNSWSLQTSQQSAPTMSQQ